jgi:dTDP-4-dehydrorhamnose reductase
VGLTKVYIIPVIGSWIGPPQARKAAVIGSAGQLGVELVRELNQRGYQTIGWDRSGQPIRVVEDHMASPTYAPVLAARTIDLVERGQTGVFHIGGGTPISWFHYAQSIFAVAQPGQSVELHKDSRPAERRGSTTARSAIFALQRAVSCV